MAVSESLKKDTYSNFDINKDIHVIPNFVDCSKNKDLIKRIDYANENQKILSHVSNFRPVKRIVDVIKIFKIVSDTLDSKLILVGDGPERYKAEALCRELIYAIKLYLLVKFPIHRKF